MATPVVQTFPRKQGDQIVQRRWSVDLDAARRRQRWAGEDPARLAREALEMAQHLPRWVLTVSTADGLQRCRRCEGVLVFDRGLRCAVCEAEPGRRDVPAMVRLAWFGLMPPVGLDGLTHIKDAIGARPPKGHVAGSSPGIGTYLLVPLVASYPDGFPDAPLQVAYQPGFFTIRGMPAPGISHAVHMLDRGTMCLFASGQWRREMTSREVLQQRAYAHVIKLLNFANGKRDAFAIVS